MDNAERMWEHCASALRHAQERKWDDRNNEVERKYYQGRADALRQVMTLFLEDDERHDEYRDRWNEFVLGAQAASADYLCPIDRSPLKFVRQSIEEQRYRCPKGHGEWSFDWRATWQR